MARFLKAFRRMVQPLEVHGFVHQFRLFFAFELLQAFGTRRNGVDQAWSNGMAVILLILGVFTWWMCITKDGGHDDLLRAFTEVSFSKSSYLSPSLPPWRPAIQGLEL